MNVYIDQMVEFKDRFFRFGGTMGLLLRLLGDDELMKFLVETAVAKADANPFEQTVEEQVEALRRASELGGWGIEEAAFERLLSTAPAWPKGRDAFRSFRIRFGEGEKGVALTFERHAEAMKRVHDPKFRRWELLRSDTKHLRLLSGNETHHAVVEWVVINDLSANRKRKDITSVRSVQSLADEGLVLAWLFPNRVRAIDYKALCAWFCAGYEVNVPEHDDEGWQDVVFVYRGIDSGKAGLDAGWRGGARSDFSVAGLG